VLRANDVSHKEPLNGDHGIRYEPAEWDKLSGWGRARRQWNEKQQAKVAAYLGMKAAKPAE